MPTVDSERLRAIKTLSQLIAYLRDELDWPVETDEVDDITFDWTNDLGLEEEHRVKIKHIKQLRPLHARQPWGIFFIEFEKKKLPVVVLRRILSHLVIKKRAAAKKANTATWHAEDLLFVSAFGEEVSEKREIAFAHFRQDAGDLPTLRVLGWDGSNTVLKLEHVAATLREKLHWPANPNDHAAWRAQWSAPFQHRLGHVIRTADALAEALAQFARRIRDAARLLMKAESDKGSLRKLFKAFQGALIHDLTEEDFADTYAQTITYGLLTAAISRTEMSEGRHGTALIAENITEMVPITNPFLRDMLQTFLKAGGRKGGIDFDELGIQDVVELLRGDETDLPAVLRDFGDKTRGDDPVIHFYEHFLSAYNKQLKIQRGVFYTPQPVVSYIVRSVHELLQTEFGLEDGLASTATWGEMAKRVRELKIPEGMKHTDAFVQVLDPATGTATFLVEVITVIYNTLRAAWKKQGLSDAQQRAAWNAYVPKDLLPRLHGYELMMAPYAIAHMKIGLKLYETGYRFGSDERARIYLTNALEPAQDFSDRLAFDAPALAKEAEAVNAVKRRRHFTVVIGNPPYSNFGQMNRIPFILKLLDDYKKGLQEKKLNLDDDFIKFLRLAQFLVEESGTGVLGFITNNTYLDGITHRQLRKTIHSAMSKVYVLDLHGSVAKREKSPDGLRDENVFDIQQGVGISFWIKGINKSRASKVFHRDLWGDRRAKYSWLQDAALSSECREIAPVEPYFFFVPKNFNLQAEYQAAFGLPDIFEVNGAGIQTDRDELFFGYSKEEVDARLRAFFTDAGLSQKFRDQYRVENSSSYPILERRKTSRFERASIQQCLYRPFDIRWVYYQVGLTSRPAWDVMQHMVAEGTIGLLAMRQFEYDVPDCCYFLATKGIAERRVFVSNRGAAACFPLYLRQGRDGGHAELFEQKRRPNFKPAFLFKLANSLGVDTAGEFSLPKGIEADEIFYYIYSIFHSPTYRRRYFEFLKVDFPRVPLTTSRELFGLLAHFGSELAALHLLESSTPDTLTCTYIGSPNPAIEKVAFESDTVWIDKARTQGFTGIPRSVWNFNVGGYQVCEKWLKERKDMRLSDKDIAHYKGIVSALHATIQIMAEIDKAIEKHGGWPIK